MYFYFLSEDNTDSNQWQPWLKQGSEFGEGTLCLFDQLQIVHDNCFSSLAIPFGRTSSAEITQ